jgi:SAM-dependent methyltransferase
VSFGVRTRAKSVAREIMIRVAPRGKAPDIVVWDGPGTSVVDDYWNQHTVNTNRFASARESEEYLRKRNSEYPMFTELMDLYGDHAGEVVLDYGCGPGDDVMGFLLWSKAAKVIGMDISGTALGLLRDRIALHHADVSRVELVKITDVSDAIPLADGSVDWIQCGGVLHHTSNPRRILQEFKRVMKPGAQGRLMLYNRDSVFFHLWIAYAQMIVNDAFPGLTIDQAFTKSTDGPDCPISEAWAADRVLEMVSSAGLKGTFRGGYVNVQEIEFVNNYRARAMADPRLAEPHRMFISELEFDKLGYPMWHGKYAGAGGVYTIEKESSAPAR